MSGLKITNLKQFNRDWKKWMDRTEDDMTDALAEGALRLMRQLITLTPYDTHRAAAGWIPTVDAPPSNWKPQEGQSSYQPLITFPADQKAKIKFNSFIHISNNVKYIKALEDGHSTQRPTGFVDIAFEKTRLELIRQLKKVNPTKG